MPAYKFRAYGVSIASNVDLGSYLLCDDSEHSELEFTSAELRHCTGPYPYTAPCLTVTAAGCRFAVIAH